MKKIFKVFMLFLLAWLIISCSVESIIDPIQGLDGKDGIDGVDGLNAVQSWQTLSGESSYCANGGLAINIGLDINRNGVLDINEISSTNYLCNGTNGVDGVDGIDGTSAYATTTIVEPSEEYPWGGYRVTIVSASGTESFVIENGARGSQGPPGVQGEQGLPGVDGINGADGASVAVRTIDEEGGTWIIFTVGEVETYIFVKDGVDGIDGINGLPGIDGQDGISATVRVEQGEGGYWLYIGVGENIEKIFISNGTDGTDGNNGYSTSIKIEIYEGEFCEFGGYSITTSSTDPTVEDVTIYICSCECEVDDSCDEDDEDNDPKIELCHKQKVGNDWRFVTIYVPQSAVQAHLDHGDFEGTCDN